MDADVPAPPDPDLAAIPAYVPDAQTGDAPGGSAAAGSVASTPGLQRPDASGADTTPGLPPAAAVPALDLDAITADLDGVETALSRLSDGTYWTDEVTGEPLPDELLAASPTARRA